MDINVSSTHLHHLWNLLTVFILLKNIEETNLIKFMVN